MATVSGSSTSSAQIYNQLVASNKGIGGLVTGLDTEDLVEKLVSGTRSKIAKQNQAKTMLQWKMTAYRGIATAMRAFQNKWISSKSSASSMGSYAFWNVNKATSSDPSVTVSAGSTATTGDIKIETIKQVASAQSISTKQFTKDLTGDEITIPGTGLDLVDKTMTISYNGSSRTIKLNDLSNLNMTTNTWSASSPDFEYKLQELIDNAFGSGMIDVSVDPGLGPNGYEITLEPVEKSATVIVTNNVTDLGFSANTGNRLPTGTTLKDMPFGSNLIGEKFTFSVNGVSFTFNKDSSMSEICTKVTSSTAGVRMEWDSVKQCYTITAKTTGAGENIVLEDVEGNFLNELIGARGGNTLTSGTTYTNFGDILGGDLALAISNLISSYTPAINNEEDLAKALKSHVFYLTVDGKKAGFTLNVDKDDIALAGGISSHSAIASLIVNSLNDQMESYFGTGVANEIKFQLDVGGNIEFATQSNKHHIKLESFSDTDHKDALADIFGFGTNFEQANKVVSGYSLTVTGGGGLDYVDLYQSNNLTSYTMEVVINGVNRFVRVDIDLSTLTFNSTYDGNPVTSYADIMAALADCDPITGLQPDQAEYDRLEALLSNTVRSDLQTQLNDSLQTAFAVVPAVEEAKTFTFAVSSAGVVTLTTTDKSAEFEINNTTDSGTSNLFSALSFNCDAAGNVIFPAITSLINDRGTTLNEIYGLDYPIINTYTLRVELEDGTDELITYNTGMTIQELVNKINSQVAREVAYFENGELKLSGNSQGMELTDGGPLMNAFFGTNSLTALGENYAAKADVAEGKNTIIKIDGQDLVYTSDTFTYKGVTIEVSKVHNWGVVGVDPITLEDVYGVLGDDPITIRVTSDTDAVVDKLKDFIEEYNALIDLLYSTITEKKSSGYDPLTDEQKAEMSETEINNWEAEAKKGLLRSDTTLRSVMDQLRSVMYSKADPDGIGIWDIGITTMSIFSASGTNYSNSGKLQLDEDGEAKLRDMLENNIDAVRDLFTNEDSGLVTKMNKVITDACNESTGAQGSLVRMAGTDTVTGDNESYLSKRIDAIDEYIAKLKTRLESEYNRYWKQFTSLETAISRMNAQMAYLDGMYS